jgi:hypothetical protein
MIIKGMKVTLNLAAYLVVIPYFVDYLSVESVLLKFKSVDSVKE